ncbi:MAG: NAD-dependent epimerase/dehydratase family protein [Candidatus Omnitrophica bacterium]|nr:NAD-dependent epimerase/dehydratase family protein [Candidatus Omnitrophota bacterium]
MVYLITGISGFVGAHLVGRLVSQGHAVTGLDAVAPAREVGRDIAFHQLSLMDRPALQAVLERVRPERIIHLASASSVGVSWQQPLECFVNNTNIFLNLVDTVRACQIPCRILSVGSSEEYGPVAAADMPLREDRPANPISPYAVARVAQEQLSRVYSAGYGLDIVCTRSFNHLGPGQTDRFVVSSFVRQAVEVALGKRPAITCGNLDIVRDFVDVRDVVRAYEIILDRGVAGEIYNVCSGRGVSLRELLDRVCGRLGIASVYNVAPELIRPADNPVIIGDGSRLASLGFRGGYELDRSLEDMVLWWRDRLAGGAA